jgi:hypothetical protein
MSSNSEGGVPIAGACAGQVRQNKLQRAVETIHARIGSAGAHVQPRLREKLLILRLRVKDFMQKP